MRRKIVVEVFPGVQQKLNCCESSEPAESADCCPVPEKLTSDMKEYVDIKRMIKEQYHQEVNVHIYDYTIPMDRAMAKRKLISLVKQRGFSHIQGDRVMEFATPAVIIDGQLVSFAQPIEYALLERKLKVKI